MRIISGTAKGKMLTFPAESRERPTSDFLRQALFNLLGSVEEKIFLDLFAGSGSVGFGSGSRGAGKVYFVEKDKKLGEIIKKNIEKCCLERNCLVKTGDVESILRELYGRKYKIDIIFADPPYNQGMVGKTIVALKKYAFLNANNLIIIQHSIKENFTEILMDDIHIADQRKYGDTALTFLEMEKK